MSVATLVAPTARPSADVSRPRALLLRNPTARRAARGRDPAVLEALAAGGALDVADPADADAAVARVRAAARDGTEVVIVAGGDGTIRLAVEALATLAGEPGTRVPALGIVPCGTANDLARALGVPRDARAAAARLAGGATPRPLPLVDAGTARFCAVGGLGLVTTAALTVPAWRTGSARAQRVARLAGAMVYRLAASAALLRHGDEERTYAISRLTPAGVRQDDTLRAHGLFVAMQSFTGGGLRVPGGGRADGTFDLVVVRAMSRPRLLVAFARLALGLPVPPSAIAVLPAREAHVVASDADVLMGDGDRLGAGRIFHLRAVPDALRVLV